MSRFLDPAGRGPKAPTLALRGVVFGAALAVGAGLMLALSQGAFEDKFEATALVADVGDGLPIGSDVKLRGVLIGRVASVDSIPGQAQHTVRLDLKPQHAPGIPASVQARIIPTNIFGAPSVDLVPDAGDTRRLAEGATIPADVSAETVKMQTAIDKLHDVLKAVQPAKLNAALHNISRALQGQGAQIGDTIARLDSYLTALNPHAGTFGANLVALGDALEGLQKSAPALLDTVDSLVTTTKTIVEKEDQFVAALTAGARTSDAWDGFLDKHGGNIVKVMRTTRPITGTMARQHNLITVSFKKLGNAVDALSEAFDKETGYLTMNLALTATPFDMYTAQDCPRYGSHAGPNCGGPMPAGSGTQQTTRSAPPPDSTLPPATPQDNQLLDGLLGGTAGDLGELLLGPLLNGSTLVIGR